MAAALSALALHDPENGDNGELQYNCCNVVVRTISNPCSVLSNLVVHEIVVNSLRVGHVLTVPKNCKNEQLHLYHQIRHLGTILTIEFNIPALENYILATLASVFDP